jgi:hypothetical protein
MEMIGNYLTNYGAKQYLSEAPYNFHYSTGGVNNSSDEYKELKDCIDYIIKIKDLPVSTLKTEQKTFFNKTKNLFRFLNNGVGLTGVVLTQAFIETLPLKLISFTIIAVINQIFQNTISKKEFELLEEDCNEVRSLLYQLKNKCKNKDEIYQINTLIRNLEDLMNRYNCNLNVI